jgi:F-type H+-transporting ATPase subunit delta
LAKGFAARHYARALFELGNRANQLDAWLADLTRLTPVVADAAVAAFLEHPKIGLKEKAGLLTRNLAPISQETLNLVYLLIERGMVRRLGEVTAAYRLLVDAAHGIERGYFKTAVPVDAAEAEDINRWVSGVLHKNVMLTGEVDASILGGVTVRVGDKLLDGSTRTALGNLRQKLTQA